MEHLVHRGNTVMGMPESEFREGWIAMLWLAMGRTGRGYRKPSTRHTGRQNRKTGEWDRRADKLEFGRRSKLERRLLGVVA